ncbi:MAG: ATP-dependent Clp protease adaptor ClpS [Alphaproteobacteria bacterium]
MSQKTQNSPEIVIENEQQQKKPRKWNVIFFNDDFTPMDFVVDVLMIIFHHTQDSAINIMLAVHHQGRAIAGTYTWEIAEAKSDKVMGLAAQNEYPLQVVIEPLEGK